MEQRYVQLKCLRNNYVYIYFKCNAFESKAGQIF